MLFKFIYYLLYLFIIYLIYYLLYFEINIILYYILFQLQSKSRIFVEIFKATYV